MTDIAELGLKIDSSPVSQATQALNTFAGAATAANTAAQGLQKTAASTGQAMAAQVQAAANSAQAINAANAGMMAYGQQLNTLRERFVPLSVIQKQYNSDMAGINQAVRMGAISEAERADAVMRTEAAYRRQVRALSDSKKAMDAATKGAALSSYQMTNLAFQLNDVATMASMGMDPFKILASQAGQFYQILSMGEGGTKGSLSYLGSLIVGMITPVRVLGAGLAALGITAVAALKGAVDDAIDTQVALSGIGRASGATAEDINGIAIAAAQAREATVGEARQIALALTATGKISPQITAGLVSISRQFAATFGEDLPEAAERMARAFSDPARGVDDLNKRLAVFDDRTRQLILNLTAQNRTLDAQRVMMAEVERGLVSHIDSTSKLGRKWQNTMEDMSFYWEKLKGYVSRQVDGPNLEEQLKAAREELQRLSDGAARWPSLLAPGKDEIQKQIDKVKELNDQLNAKRVATNEAAKDAKAIGDANTAGDLARSIVGDYGELQRATNELVRLRDAIGDPAVFNKLDGYTKLAVLRAQEMRELQVEWLKGAVEAGGIGIANAREEHDIAISTIKARTVAQKADVAYQQELARARREDPTSAVERASMARTRVLEESRQEEIRAIEERNFRQAETIDQMKLEAELVGVSTQRAAALRAEWQAIADAKRRAFERGETLSGDALNDAKANAQAYSGNVMSMTAGREGKSALDEYKTVEEADRAHYERRMQLLKDFSQSYGATAAESAQLYARIQEEYMVRTQTMYAQTASRVGDTLSAISGALDGNSKKQFEMQKALSIATAVLKGYESAVSAYAAGSAIGGPPVGAAYAALSVAATAAMIAQVRSASFSGGGKASVTGGSSSSKSRSGSNYSASSPAPTQNMDQNVTINLQGSRYSREEVRDLINSLNDVIRDGTQLQVTTS